jgi:hypothetical protein
MPAPALLSDPAMVRTTGMFDVRCLARESVRSLMFDLIRY